VPVVRPFRAIRYDVDSVGDLSRVVSPPYDVISPAEQAALLARHPANVVRLDLPSEAGSDPDEKYREAARTFARWRSEGILRKDPRPSVYVYEQVYRVPGSDVERTQRGFLGRLRLERFGSAGGVLPHERTLSGPREDRYRLLRATGANFSPVVGLYEDPSGRAPEILARAIEGEPLADVTDDDGVRHRLWALPAVPAAEAEEGVEPGPVDDPATELADLAGVGPVTIADGHHRYETALRYRDERRMVRSCEEDPAFDYLLMLFLETMSQPLTVLPTHRVVHGLGDEGVERLLANVGELFDAQPADPAIVSAPFSVGAPGGEGHIGLVTRQGAAVLTARRGAFEPYLPPGGDALRRLDVTLLGVALERLCGIDLSAIAAGGRVTYTKSAQEAMRLVAEATDAADAAFLLEPTPVADIAAVARQGDVMPQKSTYFFPKPATGLVINPHEW
jgi:uncharacterized protein (DUF1015 family)